MAPSSRPTKTAARQTSTRARWCLLLIVGGYFLVAVLAGAPMSPLTTPLPAGARPPAWATGLASGLGLGHLGRPGIVVIALLVMAGLLSAFVTLLVEAWSGRVRLAGVLWAAGVSVVIAIAAPLLLSRDVISYAAYGRIDTVYHQNPYVTVLASFPRDPFIAVTSRQWLHTRSLYGPAFSLISAAIVRAWSTPGAVILAFKVLAGVSIAVATLCAALGARAVRPGRSPLAAAIVGLNPVVIVHTVGGGHVDAFIAALLAGALLLAVTASPGGGNRATPWPRSAAVTILLVLATLVRVAIAPALVLWLWWMLKATPRGHRVGVAATQLALVAGLSVVLFAPFLSGLHTFTPIATFGGVESWASPSHLVARAAAALVGWVAGPAAATVSRTVVVAAFLAAFAVLFARLGRVAGRADALGRPSAIALVDAWGCTLLLLTLAWPFMLPWFGAWFVPYLGLMRDRLLARIGIAVTALLALTLIPADPFSGLSTWGVMDGVHYVVAPLMLVLFATAVARVLGWRRPRPLVG
jgi:alpha-1,6-mannosyltransferase